MYLPCNSALRVHFFMMQEAQTYAQENGLFFMETSAKTAINVNDIFYEIGKSLSNLDSLLK